MRDTPGQFGCLFSANLEPFLGLFCLSLGLDHKENFVSQTADRVEVGVKLAALETL